MSSDADFDTLLEATVQHLEDLKRRGTRFVEVDPALLASLGASAAQGAPAKSTGIPSSRPAVAATGPAPARLSSALTPAAAPASTVRPSIRGARPAPASAPPAAPARNAEPSRSFAPPSGSLEPEVERTPEEKVAALEALRPRVLACVRCSHLASSRRNVVFGVGPATASLMFVGEAPGVEEDAQGEPFVGPAGQLLTKIIQATGLSRADVFIANVLKCRPDTPGAAFGNRKPTPPEMATCLPFLREQIRIIRPRVIVALGGTAMEGLFGGGPVAITRTRGTWHTCEGVDVMPTYHPSYVLRMGNDATKRETWEDMLQVMERLGLPISEKQRRFFLKAS